MHTEILPLFPLKLVVFPNEKVNMHIFEERYKQLVNECIEKNKTFGIPAFINNKVSAYGTEVRVVAISKRYDNGKMDVSVRGERVFVLQDFWQQQENKLYPAGKVRFVELIEDSDKRLEHLIADKLLALYEVLGVKRPVKDVHSFVIGHYLGMSQKKELHLLKLQRESDRQEFILDHLTKMLPIITEVENMKKKIKLNGYFKHFDKLNF
ncbi:MAG: LON peptidase substrate-binding domain-containing protein [Chitinophagales bacterium]